MSTDDTNPGSLRDQLPPIEPPAELADRVQRSLSAKGLVHPNVQRPNKWVQALRVSAIAASFLFAGFFLGRNVDTTQATGKGQRYALLLYGGQSTPGGESVNRRREYGEWLGRVASGNRSFTGEELGPPLKTLGDGGDLATPIVGFFIVSADSDAAAQSIAAASPHLKHGGSVVLYRVVD